MPAPVVFIDIAGPDSQLLRAFYADLFDWQFGADGNFSTYVATTPDESSRLNGTVREDKPEKVFYVGVVDVTATLEQAVALGGSIDQPRFEVPGVVVLGLFRDPAGNRIGLVEMKNGIVTIP